MASSSPKDKHNFQCVTEASLELIKLPFKDILLSQIKPEDLFLKIKSSSLLSGRNKLRSDQLNLCYFPPPVLPDYNKFDASLLYILIRNLCPGLQPTRGWGIEPSPNDTTIADDIERLRCFRNRSLAHSSTSISDDTFEDLLKTLKSVYNRLKSQPGCTVDYEQELIEIKRSKFTYDKWDTCKTLLNAYMKVEKQTDEREVALVEPSIWMKGKEEVICGDTAEFEAEVKQTDSFCLPIIWHRHKGKAVEIIDTNMEKYSGSTNTKLVIPYVRKEDAWEYQASVSRESNGNKITVLSNTICLHVLGEMPFLNDLKVTTEDEGVTIHYSIGVSENSPQVKDITWSKNGQPMYIKYDKFIGGSLHDKCLVIKSPSEDDKGRYSCTVTNAVGSETKDIVLDVPCVTISIKPTVRFASKTTITSIVTSMPQPEKTQWQGSKDGNYFSEIDVTKSKYFGSNASPECPCLVIPKTTFDDMLYYRLQISNKLGANVSNTVYLEVTGSTPSITISHETDFKNRTIKLSAAVFLLGNSPDIQEIFWSKNGEKIDILGSDGKFSGVTIDDPSLTIRNVNQKDVGNYRLTARNAIGITSCGDISIEIPFLNDLKVTTEDEGIKIHYSFGVSENSPQVQYITWSKNDQPLYIKCDKFIGGSLHDSCLIIKSPSEDDKGKYSCTVTNVVGSVKKNVILGIPDITVNHETDLSKGTIRLIGRVSLSDGSPNILEVFWTKNGERINSQKRGGRLPNVSIEDHSLTIKDVCHKDIGKYQLTAVNAVGENISEIIDLDKPDVNLFSERSGKEGTLSFTATIKSNTPCNAQWYAKCKDGDTFTPIDVNDKEYRGTTNSLPHPMLVVKQMHHLENAIYQIKVTNFVGSTTKEIAGDQQLQVQNRTEMKRTKTPRHKTTHFYTLKELFDCITDAFQLCSDQSLTHILLNAVHQDEFLSELENLAKGVENIKKTNKNEYTGRPGEICVFDVKVQYKQNQLHVVREDPENWDQFLLAKEEDGIKIIRIQSKSIGVIEAKLHVYREFKDVIDTKNILLQHVLENCIVISNVSAHKKISSFCNAIKVLKTSISSCNTVEILIKSSKIVFTQERLLCVCNNVVVENIEKDVESLKSSTQRRESKNATKILIDCLEGKIIFEIINNLCSIFFDQMLNHLQSQIVSSKRASNVDIFSESRSENIRFLVDHALASLGTSASDMAYASPHSSDEFTFDVNSKQWRDKITNELFHRIRKQEKHILFSIEVKTQELCAETLTKLETLYRGLRTSQCGIKLVNQRNLVETWQKREIKCEGKELSNFPSVMNYIAGTKYGKPFVKVFLKYEDKDEERLIRTHSVPSEGIEYEFVNVSAKKRKTNELEKIREKERKAPVLSDAIRIQLNKIINSQAETMYANFSTLTGLSVSTVRYEHGNLINDPCIVLYCLDKSLVPYGETQLPTNVGGYPCDIREGTFSFGSCADCRHANPGPGCSIGMPSDSHTGSAGFLVKSTKSPYKTGFLTAAHVAIKELLDLYVNGVFLSECNFMDNKNREIVHPSYSHIDGNNFVGNVEESFIGDYGPDEEEIGIDVAYVKSYTERLGETNKMDVAQDKFLKWDGTTRVTKKGQATGSTNGKLVQNSFSFICKFDRFPNRRFTFKNCYEIQDLNGESFFESGDSGSGVFVTENDGKTKPLGIAFAHEDGGDITLVCRLSPIIEKCNLVIYEEEEEMEEEFFGKHTLRRQRCRT